MVLLIMSKREKLIAKAKNNSGDLRFEEACRLAEIFGFMHIRTKGSHMVYARQDIQEIVNLQPGKNGKAKGYQVEQILAIAERYKL